MIKLLLAKLVFFAMVGTAFAAQSSAPCGTWVKMPNGSKMKSPCPEPALAQESAQDTWSEQAPSSDVWTSGSAQESQQQEAKTSVADDEPATPESTTQTASADQVVESPRNCSALDPTCLQQETKRLNNPSLPTMAVINPITMEEMNGYYGGYRNYSSFYMPDGFQYPAWGTQDPRGQLAAYIQQQLTVQYRSDGRWNVLIAATGQQAQILPGMDAELNTGRGIKNGQGERITNADWNTAHYSVAASVGIVEEDVRNLSIDGGRILRAAETLGLEKAGWFRRFLWETFGTYHHTEQNRAVVGVLHIMIVDNTTRTVVGSYEGMSAVSYEDFNATSMSGVGVVSSKYPGAWKFASDLVRAALLTPRDQKQLNERFVQQRKR